MFEYDSITEDELLYRLDGVAGRTVVGERSSDAEKSRSVPSVAAFLDSDLEECDFQIAFESHGTVEDSLSLQDTIADIYAWLDGGPEGSENRVLLGYTALYEDPHGPVDVYVFDPVRDSDRVDVYVEREQIE